MKQKYNAFTLAEVLITLGIIGVVAALTLPSVVANYQKKVWVAQLKETYSILSQGFQKMLSDDGVDKLSDTEIWSNLSDNCNQDSSNCGNFVNSLQKYFDITRDTEKSKYTITEYMGRGGNHSYENNGYFFKLKNGVTLIYYTFYKTPREKTSEECLFIKSNGGQMCSVIGYWLSLDINGFKHPNQYGRDIFVFYLSNEGKLFPMGGTDYSRYETSGYIAGSNRWNVYGTSCIDGDNLARSCAGQIMEQGWQMNY